jgi:hypothetical protein
MSAYKSFCTAPGRVCLQGPVLHLRDGWAARFFGFFDFFSLLRKGFCLFRLHRYRSETPNNVKQTEKCFFGSAKQTEKQPKQIEFRLVSVLTKTIFCLFQGHPIGTGALRILYVAEEL